MLFPPGRLIVKLLKFWSTMKTHSTESIELESPCDCRNVQETLPFNVTSALSA